MKFQGIWPVIILSSEVSRLLTLAEILGGLVLILRLLSIEQKLVDKIGAQAHIRVKHAARKPLSQSLLLEWFPCMSYLGSSLSIFCGRKQYRRGY